MNERNWYVGLVCRHCGRPVLVTKADGCYHRGLSEGGEAWAEHYACREEAGKA